MRPRNPELFLSAKTTEDCRKLSRVGLFPPKSNKAELKRDRLTAERFARYAQPSIQLCLVMFEYPQPVVAGFNTVNEIAERLGVCRRTVEREMAEGRLRFLQIRGAKRIPEKFFQEYLASLEAAGRKQPPP